MRRMARRPRTLRPADRNREYRWLGFVQSLNVAASAAILIQAWPALKLVRIIGPRHEATAYVIDGHPSRSVPAPSSSADWMDNNRPALSIAASDQHRQWRMAGKRNFYAARASRRYGEAGRTGGGAVVTPIPAAHAPAIGHFGAGVLTFQSRACLHRCRATT